ncbi:hypothetical protein CY34DRAFT_110599 [Suillus luteus UH-Slu-Lm8-n1]|uniref:Uncharacterized protein n=1 Tax=Suillus luteus UH-Slu-Lm8-n1 TaxID=930992 RepID=A0A0D0AH59_9AGAM|nr:hypothetical protein CY34DRAFT_110599 [Suillus luteus UH-Slu-Lm8-n1]
MGHIHPATTACTALVMGLGMTDDIVGHGMTDDKNEDSSLPKLTSSALASLHKNDSSARADLAKRSVTRTGASTSSSSSSSSSSGTPEASTTKETGEDTHATEAAKEVGDETDPPGLGDGEADREGDEKHGEDVPDGGRVVRQRGVAERCKEEVPSRKEENVKRQTVVIITDEGGRGSKSQKEGKKRTRGTSRQGTSMTAKKKTVHSYVSVPDRVLPRLARAHLTLCIKPTIHSANVQDVSLNRFIRDYGAARSGIFQISYALGSELLDAYIGLPASQKVGGLSSSSSNFDCALACYIETREASDGSTNAPPIPTAAPVIETLSPFNSPFPSLRSQSASQEGKPMSNNLICTDSPLCLSSTCVTIDLRKAFDEAFEKEVALQVDPIAISLATTHSNAILCNLTLELHILHAKTKRCCAHGEMALYSVAVENCCGLDMGG